MTNESQSDAVESAKLMSDNSTDASPPISTFRMGAVAKLLAVVVIMMVAAFVVLGPLDGVTWITNALKPKLVPVTGQVFFNGEPLSNAEITTQPVRKGLRGANGLSDENGRFRLITDVDGEFVEGAYVGQHQVAVIRRHDVITFGPAPSLTPEKYTSFGTSQLQITVGNEQAVELRLEGEASKAPQAMPPMTQRAPANVAAESPEKKEELEKDASSKQEDTQSKSD